MTTPAPPSTGPQVQSQAINFFLAIADLLPDAFKRIENRRSDALE